MIRYLITIFVAVSSLVIADLYAQGSKNILRVRFDTVTVESVPKQVFLNVYCKLEGTKPHMFRGFECRIAYEKYQIDQPIVIWTGTACANASLHKYNILSREGQILIQVLNSNDIELELNRPALFRIGFQAKSTLNDTVYKDFRGLYECFLFDDSLSSDNGIDEVIIENNGLAWVDYKPPVVIDTSIKRTNIRLSTENAQADDDSIITIPLTVSALDSARVRYGSFQFALDTSVLAFIDAQPGSILGSGGSLAVENMKDKVRILFSGADTASLLKGSGELIKLRFKALKREDTVCTVLSDTAFYVLNEDVRVDTVSYNLGTICVNGHKEPGEVVSELPGLVQLRIRPNPAQNEITIFTTEDRSCDLSIWNVLGEMVYRTAITGSATLDMRHYVPGTYRAVLMRNGRMIASQQFLIVD
jgi:hypothetical protein